jgi:hypothetical protein
MKIYRENRLEREREREGGRKKEKKVNERTSKIERNREGGGKK